MSIIIIDNQIKLASHHQIIVRNDQIPIPRITNDKFQTPHLQQELDFSRPDKTFVLVAISILLLIFSKI